MNRRKFISGTLLSAVAVGAGVYSYHRLIGDRFFNPCLPDNDALAKLMQQPLIKDLMANIDFSKVWDGHVHLIGTGDSQSGVWVTPDMRSWSNPWQHLQFNLYMNASCIDAKKSGLDKQFIERLASLTQTTPQGVRLLLLAFDYFYDQTGQMKKAFSSFHTPNDYAASVANSSPQFEWIASVHPYRKDALIELEKAAEKGAKAVKWLPPAMGMDPASPLCDAFYRKLVELNLPLLSHAGEEKAVHGSDTQKLGNPLLLRRPLEKGVTVIVAHCASLGMGEDLDNNGVEVSNFSLFSRMMDDANLNENLYGEISATIQINRSEEVIKTLLSKRDWHARLLNASDYPLPGLMPLFSLKQLARRQILAEKYVKPLSQIRLYNPWLFDFLTKRALNWQGQQLSESIFETRRVFQE